MNLDKIRNYGFKKYNNPYDPEGFYMKLELTDTVEIIYDVAKRSCLCALNEYCVIHKECDNEDDVKKFVNCIEFLNK